MIEIFDDHAINIYAYLHAGSLFYRARAFRYIQLWPDAAAVSQAKNLPTKINLPAIAAGRFVIELLHTLDGYNATNVVIRYVNHNLSFLAMHKNKEAPKHSLSGGFLP